MAKSKVERINPNRKKTKEKKGAYKPTTINLESKQPRFSFHGQHIPLEGQRTLYSDEVIAAAKAPTEASTAREDA
jgi:hypothetical protein